MKKYIFVTILALCCLSAKSELTFSNMNDAVMAIKPDANTGLEEIYVLSNTNGVTATYSAARADSNIEWQRYSQLGGAYGETIDYRRNGMECSITLSDNDSGYIITENGRQHCFWIINYENHMMTMNGVDFDADESDCSTTTLSFNGSAPRINFYTINGVPKELSRDIKVNYNTLTWDENSFNYREEKACQSLSYIGEAIHIPAPLVNTEFEIAGDRFLQFWNRELSFSTPTYNAIAIDVHTQAETLSEKYDNEKNSGEGGDELGGSAPVEIRFTAATTDAVAYREWQTSRLPEFDIIELRFNQDEVEYTFRDFGVTYVRFVAANASGTCEWTSDTYRVTIGESRLECPNAFSPGASEGVNDEWKVSYKSIISFECHIFNSWGIELFKSTDPSIGWDGKHGGKLVPAGVYYYVIKAKGADGKNYSLAGDINIINYKKGVAPQNPDL